MQIPPHRDKAGEDAEADAEGEHDEEKFYEVKGEVGKEVEFGNEKGEFGGEVPGKGKEDSGGDERGKKAVERAGYEERAADKPAGAADQAHDADLLAHGVDDQTKRVECDQHGNHREHQRQYGAGCAYGSEDGAKALHHAFIF